jgi:hypothetical protein
MIERAGRTKHRPAKRRSRGICPQKSILASSPTQGPSVQWLPERHRHTFAGCIARKVGRVSFVIARVDYVSHSRKLTRRWALGSHGRQCSTVNLWCSRLRRRPYGPTRVQDPGGIAGCSADGRVEARRDSRRGVPQDNILQPPGIRGLKSPGAGAARLLDCRIARPTKRTEAGTQQTTRPSLMIRDNSHFQVVAERVRVSSPKHKSTP